MGGKVLAEDDDGHAGGAEIFLCAGKDEAKLLYFDGFRGDVGRHVGDQRHVAHFGQGGPLRAFDGVIGADVDVGGVRGKSHFVATGKTREFLRFRGGRDMVKDTFLQFTNGFGGPGAGMEDVNGLSREAEVHGGHGELHAAAALDEDDGVVV